MNRKHGPVKVYRLNPWELERQMPSNEQRTNRAEFRHFQAHCEETYIPDPLDGSGKLNNNCR